MELSLFTPAYVANETLKMNLFEFKLNHKLKVEMSICPYSSYRDMYDIVINVRRAQNEREVFFNKQGDKRKARPQDYQNQQPQHKRPQQEGTQGSQTGGYHQGVIC